MSTTKTPDARERILRAAWAMIEEGRLEQLTMGAVGAAAGVSRQTVYVQFGTRAGLLLQLVRERDETSPRLAQLEGGLRTPDPEEALLALTRALAGWWQDIHPIAKALHAAAATDEGARAAWDDRMTHLRGFTGSVAGRLADAGRLAPGWDADDAAEWLAAQLNPIVWALLTEQWGWSQERYEDRMAAVVRAVLIGRDS